MSGHLSIGELSLSRAESIALSDCEARIEQGMKTFLEVGMALAAIRENKLYRASHETFEAYCSERWGFTGRRGRQLIEAAEIGTVVPIDNEAQARELAKVAEPERADVWREAVERTDGKPTAAAVREVHQERTRSTPTPGPSDAAVTPPVGPGATPAPAASESPVPAAPQEPDPTPEPPPGSPATWTPEQHEANRLEIQRKASIAACERTADALVLEIRGMVTTIIDGLDFGAPGIPVTMQMIDECREAIDRLEARVIGA